VKRGGLRPRHAQVDTNTNDSGHVITTTAVARDGRKHTLSYSTERVVGNGSFGVVFQVSSLSPMAMSAQHEPCPSRGGDTNRWKRHGIWSFLAEAAEPIVSVGPAAQTQPPH
jgi:hypothetical protein